VIEVTRREPHPLTNGDWTLVYGDGDAAFSVPYEGAPICAANPRF